VDAGSYVITPSGLLSPNYSISYVSSPLSITIMGQAAVAVGGPELAPAYEGARTGSVSAPTGITGGASVAGVTRLTGITPSSQAATGLLFVPARVVRTPAAPAQPVATQPGAGGATPASSTDGGAAAGGTAAGGTTGGATGGSGGAAGGGAGETSPAGTDRVKDPRDG
jgi:hypothetical protein